MFRLAPVSRIMGKDETRNDENVVNDVFEISCDCKAGAQSVAVKRIPTFLHFLLLQLSLTTTVYLYYCLHHRCPYNHCLCR